MIPMDPETLRTFIEHRKNYLFNLEKRFFDYNPDMRLEILNEGRRLINDIINGMTAWAEDEKWFNEFEAEYKKVRKKLSRYVSIPRLPSETRRAEMQALREELIDKMGLYRTWSLKNLEQKLNFFDEVFEHVEIGDIFKAFNPRMVLFSVPSDKKYLVDEAALKAYKQRYYNIRRNLSNRLEMLMESGYSHTTINKRVFNYMKKHFKTGTIPVPYRETKVIDGVPIDMYYTREYSLGHYCDTWIRDWYTISDSKAQLAGAHASSFDLVKISGGGTGENEGINCPICHKYHGKTYSLSGRHPDYPKLVKAPPFHPNCEHYLSIITASYSILKAA